MGSSLHGRAAELRVVITESRSPPSFLADVSATTPPPPPPLPFASSRASSALTKLSSCSGADHIGPATFAEMNRRDRPPSARRIYIRRVHSAMITGDVVDLAAVRALVRHRRTDASADLHRRTLARVHPRDRLERVGGAPRALVHVAALRGRELHLCVDVRVWSTGASANSFGEFSVWARGIKRRVLSAGSLAFSFDE